jgi:HEAT repeat protein
MGETPPLEVFLNALKDPDLQVRTQAANALQLRGEQNETILAKLVECLADTNPTFQSAVLRTIGRLSKPDSEILKILPPVLSEPALQPSQWISMRIR